MRRPAMPGRAFEVVAGYTGTRLGGSGATGSGVSLGSSFAPRRQAWRQLSGHPLGGLHMGQTFVAGKFPRWDV